MDSFQIFIGVIVLAVFVIGISAIIITIAENRHNSVIFTADEAKELSNRRVKKKIALWRFGTLKKA